MSYYEVDYEDFADKFIPWFLREYGFEYKDGDFKTGDTLDQEMRFIVQARNGHFYQYIRIGVGIDRFLNANIDKQKLNKRIRSSLKYDQFIIESVYIVTQSDIDVLGITNTEVLSILEQDKYILAIEARRTNQKDGIFVNNDGTGSFLAFIKSIMAGVQYINDLFYAFVTEKKEELKFNGQIINLQRRLNDVFDDTLRRIYIANIASIPVQYLYRSSEFVDDYVYRISEAMSSSFYVGRTSEIGTTQYDFIVYVPVALTYNTDRMNAVINRYKLADKTHNIETY
jgi:hypothetical protein